MTLRIRLSHDGHLYLDGASAGDRAELQTLLASNLNALEYIQSAAWVVIARNEDVRIGDWAEFPVDPAMVKPEPLWRLSWEWEWKPKASEVVQ